MRNKVVVVSGGFDPLHSGHVNLFRDAKALGDELIVVINNDVWLTKKKGFVFMPEIMRVEIIKAISYVDDVFLSTHTEEDDDMSVCKELRMLRPNVFANGGDRFLDNIPEVDVCKKLNIEMVFNVGGAKTASSSELVLRAKKNKFK